MAGNFDKEMIMFDVIIIGGGPAGLSAAIYAGRALKKTLLIENNLLGGQLNETIRIENYPGGASESGSDLIEKMKDQAKQFDVEFVTDDLKSVDLRSQPKKLIGEKQEYLGKTVIISTGSSPRKLGLEKEDDFSGQGISYCSTCDGAFYKGLPVYVVGGGDAAFDEGISLSQLVKHVTILYRGPHPRASASLQEQVKKKENMDLILNTEVIRLLGDTKLEGIVIKNSQTGEEKTIKEEMGLFIFAGHLPNTDLFKDQLGLDHGYIKAGPSMETEIQAVFAAGDVRIKKIRQAITAAADGCIAAMAAIAYLDAENRK